MCVCLCVCVRAHVCVCVYVCNTVSGIMFFILFLSEITHTTHHTCIHTLTRMHACTHTHTRTHTHTSYTYTHMHTHAHTHVHTHTYTHTHNTRTHTQVHTCTHTHETNVSCAFACYVFGHINRLLSHSVLISVSLIRKLTSV